MNSTLGHNIVADGYDKGRDAILAAANATSSINGVTYKTVVQMVTGLLTSLSPTAFFLEILL